MAQRCLAEKKSKIIPNAWLSVATPEVKLKIQNEIARRGPALPKLTTNNVR